MSSSANAQTKADPSVSASEFKVRVENTKAEVLRTWDSYSDVPAQIKMVPGSYKLVAWYGGENLPAFESPYYYGESKIAVTAGNKTETAITAKHAGARVFVDFKESFAFNYKRYYVELKTTGDSLRYTADEKRGGYFTPGTLRMRFCLVKENGDSVNYVSDKTIALSARDSYTLHMDVSSNTGGASITIVTDDGTNDTTIEVEIPGLTLPKAAPVATPTGFTLGGAINTTEGISKTASMALKAPGGLKNVYLKTASTYLQSLGWPAQIDLINGASEFKTLLKNSGVSWSSELDDAQIAAKTYKSVFVNFANLIKNINNISGSAETSSFEVVAVDNFGQTNSSAKFDVVVSPVAFSLVTPTSGNVFAKSAEFVMNYNSERGVPLVQVLSGSEWTTPAQHVVSNTAGKYVCRIDGLSPETSYSFRALMHSHVPSQVYTFTTEKTSQVPNNTMDQWNTTSRTYKYALLTQTIKTVHPYASGETDIWWATRNPASTSQTSGYTNIYCSNNGTTNVDVNGNTAAQIQTTAWGSFNTSIVNGGGTKKNKTAGVLFIGSYNFTVDSDQYLTGETMTQSKGFASRPATFNFRYMYAPLNAESFHAYAVLEDRSSGTTKEIARAEITSGTAYSSMTQASIPFVYNETNKYLRATHISIFFISSTADTPSTTNSGTSSMHYGSKLTVDDITLGYDF